MICGLVYTSQLLCGTVHKMPALTSHYITDRNVTGDFKTAAAQNAQNTICIAQCIMLINHPVLWWLMFKVILSIVN